MARTVQQIYNEILDEKTKYSSLNDLTDTRSTAIWRTIYYSIATTISVFEQINDLFRTELLQTAETLPVGTKYWYAEQMKKYQEGYKLIFNRETGKVEYSKIDEDARIIVGASCVNESDTIVLKVCKDDNGVLTKLTDEQINSCRDYVNDFKFAGSITRIVSLLGDDLKISMKVRVDKNKINSLGQSVTDDTIYPVKDAVNEFLYTFGTTSFDDEFLLINLTDAIQKVDGVMNVVVNSCECKPDTEPLYLDVLQTELQTYKAEAGYLKLTELNITYI